VSSVFPFQFFFDRIDRIHRIKHNKVSDKVKYSENNIYSEKIELAEYLIKVGKKGELYTPKKMRMKMHMNPGTEFVAVVKGDELLLKRRKTISDILDEDALTIVSQMELKKERSLLEKKLMDR